MAEQTRRVDERGKRPISVAAGPYGHPFHPILVTVPIGAWVASLVFDLISFPAGEPEVFTKGAFWLIGIGIVGALVAAIFGFMDLVAVPRGTRPFKTGFTHMVLNLFVVALFVVGFLLRQGQLDDPPVDTAPFVVSLVALAILGVSGWLGGSLTYHHGIRVADEETQAAGFR